jgi:hypothetical protein
MKQRTGPLLLYGESWYGNVRRILLSHNCTCHGLITNDHASRRIHQLVVRSRNAFAITETELKLMAPAAISGFKSKPKVKTIYPWRAAHQRSYKRKRLMGRPLYRMQHRLFKSLHDGAPCILLSNLVQQAGRHSYPIKSGTPTVENDSDSITPLNACIDFQCLRVGDD